MSETHSSDILLEDDELSLVQNQATKKRSNIVVIAAIGVVALIVIIVIAAAGGGSGSDSADVNVEAAKESIAETANFKASYDDIGISVEDYSACITSEDACNIVSADEECDDGAVAEEGDCDEELSVHVDEQAAEVLAAQLEIDVSEVSCIDGVCTGEEIDADLCDSLDSVDCKEDAWNCEELLSMGDCQEGLLTYNDECGDASFAGCEAYGYDECRFCRVPDARRFLADVQQETTELGTNDDDFFKTDFADYEECSEETIQMHEAYAAENPGHACFTSTSTSTSTSTTSSTTVEEPADDPETDAETDTHGDPETHEPETHEPPHDDPADPETDAETDTHGDPATHEPETHEPETHEPETHEPPHDEPADEPETDAETDTHGDPETHEPPQDEPADEPETDAETDTHGDPATHEPETHEPETDDFHFEEPVLDDSCEVTYQECIAHVYSLITHEGLSTECDDWNEALSCLQESITKCGFFDDDFVSSFCEGTADDDVAFHVEAHCETHMFDECVETEPETETEESEMSEMSEGEEDQY